MTPDISEIVKELRERNKTQPLGDNLLSRAADALARSSERTGDMVDKAAAWDACIEARAEERERCIKAEQDCEHWAKNYDEQGQSLIKWMDRALAAEARLREYEKLGTPEALRMFLTGLATGRVTTIADVVSSATEGGK